MNRKREGHLSHSLRLWEAEAALQVGKTLEEWYTLPIIERSHIIATRIAGQIIEGLATKDAYNQARKK